MKKIDRKKIYAIICGLFTVFSFLSCVFIFPYAFGRLIESVRDFGLSCAYYFCELFSIEHGITPTVITFPKFPFFEFLKEYSAPTVSIPKTFDDFKLLWSQYWSSWAKLSTFVSYYNSVTNFLADFSRFLIIILPFYLVVKLLINRSLSDKNNDYNRDSKALVKYKTFEIKVISPVFRWFKDLYVYIRSRRKLLIIWLLCWLYNFNVFTIVIEFFAYYFYFVVSFNVISLYTQVYKLLVDLSVVVGFVPLSVWLIIAYIMITVIRRKIGYDRINHFEMKNRGFINERPIVSLVCASMRKGKTTMITDMALSVSVMFRDEAYKHLLQNDLKFPEFPWINLENVLKRAMKLHTVYNLATCRAYINKLRDYFIFAINNKSQYKAIRRYVGRTLGLRYKNLLFGYNESKGLFYNDGLKTVNIWDVIITYSQLYFIYVIQTSLLVSNYSIRVDEVLDDLGNFPLWNADLFKRDSRLSAAYSRHAHIIDFDSLRLGCKVVEENKYKDVFEFGVVVIMEVGKERGNNLELKEVKRISDVTNQKNDLFDTELKMIGHGATVDNYCFARVLTDEQRPSSWGANARELGDIIHIVDKTQPILAMPCFTYFEMFYDFLTCKFNKFYAEYRYSRGDNILFMYLFKKLYSFANSYYTKIYNTFSYIEVNVQLENGVMDGYMTDKKYYFITKKIYANRFATDGLSDFFNTKSLRSSVGLCDLPDYATERASYEEMKQQNSYFMNDLINMEKK